MKRYPVNALWDGESLIPTRHSRHVCDKQFVIGEVYTLECVEDRSSASHRHFFALLKEAWETLPESLSAEFPTTEHLRKRALIMTGHRDEKTLVAASKAEALRLAAFIRPIDEFSVVAIDGCVVKHLTAHSQSVRAMGKALFQKSKDDVLAYAASLSNSSPEELGRAA